MPPPPRHGDSLPPSECLLADCVAAVLQTKEGLREAWDRADVDWGGFVELARRHGLAPLAAAGLPLIVREVPEEIREELRRSRRDAAAWNLMLAGELVRILDLLCAAGVDAIVFKGAAQAVMSFGDLALRPFCDLDLLVARDRMRTAADVLTGSGFVPETEVPPDRLDEHLDASCELNFDSIEGRVHVEIHWAILPREFAFDLTAEEMIRSGREILVGGKPVRVPSTEQLLVALCAHGTKHGWERLMWVADLAGLLQRADGLEWPEVWKLCRRHRCERMVLVGLGLSEACFGVRLHDSVRERMLKDPRCAAIAGSFLAGIRAPGGAIEHRRRTRVSLFQLRPHWRDRCRLLWHAVRWALIPNDRDKAWVRLPAGLSFLYVLLRPLRLVWQYGRGRRSD